MVTKAPAKTVKPTPKPTSYSSLADTFNGKVHGSTATGAKGGTQKVDNTKYGDMAYDVKSGGRERVRQALIAAGQISKKTNSDSAIANAWDRMLEGADTNNTDPFTYAAMLAKNVQASSTSSTSSKNKATSTTYVSNYFDKTGKPTSAAASELTAALTASLGHVPTAQDVKDYSSLLTEMYTEQKKGTFNTTQTYDPKTGKQVTTSGVSVSDWLKQKVAATHQSRVASGVETAQQSNLDDYTRLAASYGFNVFAADGKTLSASSRQQLALIDAGKLTLNDAAASFKAAALAQYPSLKAQFDAGLTVDDVASAGKKAIANILERDINTISNDDPLVQKYLQGTNGKGVIPMYEYESMLRKDPSWQFTNNAHSTFADLAMNIGRLFGGVA